MRRNFGNFLRYSKKAFFLTVTLFFLFFVGFFFSLLREKLSRPLSFGEEGGLNILLLLGLLFLAGAWGMERRHVKVQRKRCQVFQKNLEDLRKKIRQEKVFKERHDALFHRTSSGVLFLTPQGLLEDCNSRAAEILGLSRKELLSSMLWSFLDDLSLQEAFHQALEKGMGEYQGELDTLGGNEKRYVQCRFLSVDPEEAERGIYCIIQDFTQEYRMRRNLEESEDFLNMVINFLPVGLLFVDDATNIICRANEYILRRLGKREELFSECPYSQMIQRIPLSEKNLQPSNSSFRAECLLKGGNEELLPVLRNYVYVRYREQVLRLESFIDIGERKKAEEALQRSREALAEANALAHLGSFELDLSSFKVFVTEDLYSMLGFTPGGIESLEDILCFVYPGDRQKARDLFQSIREDREGERSKKEYSQEIRLKRPYRGMGWFVFRARRGQEALREQRVFVTLQDITELRLMEKAVRESEKKYRGMFESLQDVYFKCNYGGLLVEISPSVKKLGGYDPEEVIGLGAEVFFENPFQKENLRSRLLLEGSVSDFEISLKGSDGAIRYVSMNCHVLRDAEGTIQAYEGMLRNISDRILGEQAMRTSEQKFRGIFEYSRDAVVLIRKGRFMDCNNRALQIFGYENKEDFFRKTPIALSAEVQPDGRASLDLLEIMEDVMVRAAEDIPVFEWMFLNRKGEPFLAEVQLSPILLEEAPAIQALVRDVTERKKQEDQRRTLSEVIHQSPLSIMVCDRNGIIEYVNAFSQQKAGRSQEELEGKNLYSYLREYLCFEEEEVREIAKIVTEGSLWSGESRGCSVDDAHYIEYFRILPLFDASRETVLRIAFMGEDVTEQKHMERALVEARETAESASRSKSIFLANMSHEIRTPMNAILGYSQLLQREEGFTPKQKEFLDIIGRSGEHLLVLINDILEMSKIEAGRITLNRESGNLQMLLRDIENMFRIRAEEKGLSLSVSIRENVPPWITADHDKIRQVILNLLSNALKFTRTGGIALRVSRENASEESQDILLAVEVEDTGCGIAQEEVEKVFSSFEQTDSGIKHGGGTGLGMAISRQYARLMGGDITVKSELGRGSVFCFTFSCSFALPGENREKERKISGFDFRGRNIRILVVDDSATNRDVLVRMLEQVGFITAQAEGGEEALSLFQSWNPHVILMDYRMGDMDGYEATDRIRQVPGGQEIPVIMVTASVLEEKRKEALNRGINGFLRKPFRRDDLFSEIAKNLSLDEVYEETPKEEEARSFAQVPLSGNLLSPNLRKDLIDATEFGDEERLRHLLESVREEHEPFAGVLLRMVDDFDYDGILRVLREEESA